MKTIKPQKISVLTRVFEHRRRKLFVPTLMVAFPLDHPEVLLHEVVLWKKLYPALPHGLPLDEMMFKPRAEALLAGNAYPPGGKPNTTCAARMQIGAVDKTVVVVGDRRWGATGPSPPKPFTSIPLDWAGAFGGPSHAANPLGRGAESIVEDGKKLLPLPNLEYPNKLIKSRSDQPPPATFAPIPYQFAARQQLAGSYDEQWRKTRYPGFADDIELSMFNVAAEDQRLDGYLKGGEPFVLENVHPERVRITGRLPTLNARCFVTRSDQRDGDLPPLHEVQLQRDTIFFFPNAGCGVLFFRGILPIEQDDASDIYHLLAAAEAADAPKPLEHYRDVFARRLDRDKGPLAAMKDADLLPATNPGRTPLAIEQFGDMEELMKDDGLFKDNQRRAAQRQLDRVRQLLVAEGQDPDKRLPQELPAEPAPPDLENLEPYIEQIHRQAEEGLAKADEQRAELMAKADNELAQLNIDKAEYQKGVGGPPAFSAADLIKNLEQQLALRQIAQQPTGDLQAQLESSEWRQRLYDAEAGLKDDYRKFAHEFPPAASDPERARAVRQEVMHALAAGEALADRDLTGVDLSGLDLRGVDLSGCFMERADLSDTLLQGANLSRAVLCRARIARSQLAGANLSEANLGDADIEEANLDKCDAKNAIFSKARIARSQLTNMQLEGAELMAAVLSEVSFAGASAHRLTFMQLDLNGVDFSKSLLSKSKFIDCSLVAAQFEGATMEETVLVGCTARDTSFFRVRGRSMRITKGSVLSGSNFRGASLDGAAFRETNFRGADFRDSSLKGADLNSCDLSKAKLTNAQMQRAMLMKADLTRADARGANLMEALLQKSKIFGADFRDSNLFRADFARVEGDDATKFDGALREQIRFVKAEGGMGS